MILRGLGVALKDLFRYSPLIDNLQILDPFNLNFFNLLKPRVIIKLLLHVFL